MAGSEGEDGRRGGGREGGSGEGAKKGFRLDPSLMRG